MFDENDENNNENKAAVTHLITGCYDNNNGKETKQKHFLTWKAQKSI